MANRRDLKKDIKFLLENLIDECFLYNLMHPDKNEKKINDVINETVDLYDDLMGRISSYRRSVNSKAETKQLFAGIIKDLREKYAALSDRLQNIDK